MADVVAGLLVRAGKVLLGLRKPRGKRGNLWEMPGGKCDENNLPGDASMSWKVRERHETALQREWMEELGVEIVVGPRIATCFLDLEIPFTVTLYEVHTSGTPQPLDHVELRWVDLHQAIENMPCSPALYLHWPQVRAWLAAQDNVPTLPYVPDIWRRSPQDQSSSAKPTLLPRRDTRTTVVDGEPKTTDYCLTCGESPESGSHLPHGHEYVDPRTARASAPFEPSTLDARDTYRCTTPMCGESGVCAECRKRGAR